MYLYMKINVTKICCWEMSWLTHWGWVRHICVSKLTIIGSGNGMLPGWHQVIIWTNAGILFIGDKIQWHFNWNQCISIHENAFENVACQMAPISSQPLWVNCDRLMFAQTDCHPVCETVNMTYYRLINANSGKIYKLDLFLFSHRMPLST